MLPSAGREAPVLTGLTLNPIGIWNLGFGALQWLYGRRQVIFKSLAFDCEH